MKRKLSLLLALLTVGTMLVSCAGDGNASTETTTASVGNDDASVETTSADPNDDSLPDDLDFEGRELTFYGAAGSASTASTLKTNMYIGPDEDTGDVVDTAVLERNNAVEERLNVKLGYFGNDNADLTKDITNLILSDDSTYDMFIYAQYRLSPLMIEDYFVNANELDYFDFDKPYWNSLYMDEVTLNNDKRYFLSGDYLIDALFQLRVAFYNKTMYGDRYGDPDGLYQLVMDGDFTMDKMTSIIAESYEDLNNDGKADAGDRLGQVCYALGGTVDSFVYGTDVEFTKRNSDGTIEITMMNDKAILLAEKLNALLNQQGNLVIDKDEHFSIFKNGNTQFLGFAKFGRATDLRDMEADFGFLPHPKFDEAQDGYKSLIHDSVAVGAIPITSNNTDILGAVLEALNSETAKTVKPTWYETALKVKYTRDDISSQMIDLIYNSATTNFIYAYNYALNGIGLIYRELVNANSNDFASKYASKEPAALEALDKLTEYFNS